MSSSPKVTPRTKSPTHDVVLSDGRRRIGLKIDPKNLSVLPQTPSTLKFTGGGTKFGDWEPGMSHIQQNDWSGGRGQEQFTSDPTRFFDSQGCWTLTPEKLLLGPYWNKTDGLISSTWIEGISKVYVPLLGTNRYRACDFGPTTFSADKVGLWIRRVGSPGTLTVELRNYSGGAPGNTVHKSVTKTVSDVTDFVSTWMYFDWATTYSLSSGTTYAIVVYGAAADTDANHWEVATSSDTTQGHRSSNGTSWTSSLASLNIRVEAAAVNRKLFFFILDGALYCVSNPAAGGAPNLYMWGKRGKATSATSTTLVDTNVTVPTLSPTSASVLKIINGTGIGQVRHISTVNTNTYTVSPAWDITPDSTSEYVAYAGYAWTEVATHGLTVPVTSVCVTGNLPGTAYFAQGTTTMRRMRFDATASPPAHGFADDVTNDIDLLYTFYDSPSKTNQVWTAVNGTTVAIRRSASIAWGTNLTLGSDIPIGSSQYKITGMTDYDGDLYVAKEDSLWKVVDDVPEKVPVGLDSAPHPDNGVAIRSLGLFLFFNWQHSLERLYGKTLDDIGPWQGSGVPSGRTGSIVAMAAAYNWLFCAIDAGTAGTSSVLCWNGKGWHEIFRAPEVGQRIQNIFWQAESLTRPRLWINVNGEAYYMDFPLNTLNPLNDITLSSTTTIFVYQNEGILTTSTIDMDAQTLPKLAKEMNLISKNLASGIEARLDYQADGDIGGTTWTALGAFYQSPVDVIPLGIDNIRQIRFRLRLSTNVATSTPEIRATVMEGFARTPVKYQYNFTVDERSPNKNRRGGKDPSPDVVFDQLQQWAGGSSKVRMRSRYKFMDNREVVVEPPSLRMALVDPARASWGARMAVTLRDA